MEDNNVVIGLLSLEKTKKANDRKEWQTLMRQ